MENYLMIKGQKIELSEETVRNLEEKFGIKKKRWVPKMNERYFYIDSVCNVVSDIYECYGSDNNRIESGNVFHTKEEAEKIVRKLKSLKRIMDWKFEQQGDWKPDWNGRERNKYIRYDHDSITFMIDSNSVLQDDRNIGYFKTREIAEKCIEECESDLKIIFDIEE